MHILDSDSATLVFYGANVKVATRYESFPESGTLAISIVSRVEMLRGRCDALTKAGTSEEWLEAERRLRIAEEWLAGFPIVAIGAAAGRFDGFLKNKKFRFKRGRADLLIACIALANGATLVTRNTKDFAAIPNLKLENWAD